MARQKYEVGETGIELYEVSKWKRTTIADGKWLNDNTISPLDDNEVILAEALAKSSGDLTEMINQSTSDLYETIENTSGYLQDEIDLLEAATDVIMVYSTYSSFQNDSGSLSHLTDKDVIKVLNDETNEYKQDYYQYSSQSDSWTMIGELDPYYSKSEINEYSGRINNTLNDMDRDIGLCKQDIITCSGKIGRLEQDVSTCSGDILDLQHDVSTCSGRIINLEQDVNTCSGKIVTLQQDVSTCSGKINTLEQDVSTCSGKIDSLEHDVSVCSGRIDDLDQELDGKQDKLIQGSHINIDAQNRISANFSEASTTEAGLMSANDKKKLESIASSATRTAASSTNGNILVNGSETQVYRHPQVSSSGTYGQPSDKNLSWGDSFKVIKEVVDVYGHVTNAEEHTIAIPDDVATSASNGLMSSGDKGKIDNAVLTVPQVLSDSAQTQARNNINAQELISWAEYSQGSSIPTVVKSSLSVVKSDQGARVQNSDGTKKYFLAPEPDSSNADKGKFLGVDQGNSVKWLDVPRGYKKHDAELYLYSVSTQTSPPLQVWHVRSVINNCMNRVVIENHRIDSDPICRLEIEPPQIAADEEYNYWIKFEVSNSSGGCIIAVQTAGGNYASQRPVKRYELIQTEKFIEVTSHNNPSTADETESNVKDGNGVTRYLRITEAKYTGQSNPDYAGPSVVMSVQLIAKDVLDNYISFEPPTPQDDDPHLRMIHVIGDMWETYRY